MVPWVTKVFTPSMTYASPSRSAVVSMPAASLPWPGSVLPSAPMSSPDATPSRSHSFWASVPYSAIIRVPNSVPMAASIPASTRATSSMKMQASTWPIPAPPYSCGMVAPTRPASTAASQTASGHSPVSSCSRATGATSVSANSRAVRRTARCSSLKEKSTMAWSRRVGKK